MMDDAEISRLEARHGLMSYQFHYLRGAANFISFEGKTVLEVGGSLPRNLVFDELGVKKWICVQEYEYWDMLPESQGLERLAVVEQDNCVHKIENACEITELS